MKTTMRLGSRVRILCVVAGLALMPLLAQAAAKTWTNAGDSVWETGGNWSPAGAPSSTDTVSIVNAGSKTVTISAATPAGNLTVSNLVVEASGGATNTLLLSGNTMPLTCLSAASGVSLAVGNTASKAGALMVDGGSLATTNVAGNSSTYVGNIGKGVMTVSNGMWQGNHLYVGNNSGGNGTLNLFGGTNSFGFTANGTGGKFYLGSGAGSTGTASKIGGLLVTTNGTWAVGAGGVGTMTASGGEWHGYALSVGVNSRLDLIGGTNLFRQNWGVNGGLNSTATVSVAGGTLSNLNLTISQNNFTNSFSEMTVSNATFFCGGGITICGNPVSSAPWLQRGVLSFVDSRVKVGGIAVADYGSGTLNLTRGTNNFNGFDVCGGNASAGSTGIVWMTDGLLVTTNASIASIGYRAGCMGLMTMLNGTWIAGSIKVGQSTGCSGNSLTIRGGQVWLTNKGSQNTTVGNTTGSNNVLVVTDGGLLDYGVDAFTIGLYATGPGNVMSNSGAIYQFAGMTPGVTASAGGAVVLNGGTISFRDVSAVDIRTSTSLAKMTWIGANAFRLNAATNLQNANQSYTFATDQPNGSTNYARLELVNGNTCYRSNVTVTVGTGGSVLFSNTTALLQGSLVVTNGGGMKVVDSTVTITGACTVAENSTITWSSNALASVVNVKTLRLPVYATFTLNSPIGRNETRILFSVTNSIIGTPAAWGVTPATHRVAIAGLTTLVLEPGPRSGTIVIVR